MIYAILALLVIIGDQFVKFWVASNITSGSVDLIPGFVSLVNVHNTGAAFSFLAGANAKLIFIAIAVAVTVLVIIALATNLVSGKLGRISLVFIMAGGLGNCIDRILYGYVQDMFRLDFINFAIFNVADIFITLFAILFILYVLFGSRKSGNDDDDEYEDEDDEDEEEEEDDEEEDEEEEEKPAKRHFMRKRVEYDDDDEEEEDDEPEKPVFRKQKEEKKPSRKERRAKYEDEYEEYKRKKALREAEAQENAPASPVVNPDAPFAEWEEKPAQQPEVKPAPAAKPVADVQATRPVPAVNIRKPAAAAEATKPSPAVKPAPAAKPAPAPAPAAKPAADDDDMNFSLEDILNEFRS